MSQPDSTSVPRSLDDGRRYPGVRSFEEQDRTHFFGRTLATEELLLRVLSVRLLLQFAPSGVGKTSLLNAGLFPRLRQHSLFPFIVRLNEDKETLTQAARRSLKDAARKEGLKEPVIPDKAESLWELLAGAQLWSTGLLLLTPVLVFDQFEEVFTLRDEAFRKKFALEVGALSMGRAPQLVIDASPTSARDLPAPDVKIIISLREEYLGKLDEFSASIPDLFRERLRLFPLTADEAREAIVEPARLEGDTWPSPPFDFDAACLDGLIDFIDGASDKAKVIEPLTLQLVCQQAEAIANTRAGRDARLKLNLDDFGGLAGLERLVENFFRNELKKLGGSRAERRAREMFEQGLLDLSGKRLMLEQGEIERRYGLDAGVLNTLVDSRLLRREPRNESVFYEISHDRLTEAIAKNRRSPLPRWVRPTIAAGIVFIVITAGFAIWIKAAQVQAEEARTQAEQAIVLLLGEDLVGRLREVGLTDALQRVLGKAAIDSSSKSLASALSLRHQGDILREQGTVKEAREKFSESLEALDALRALSGESDAGLIAERARTLKRLGSVHEDSGQVSEAAQQYGQSVQAWEQAAKGSVNPQEALDASESWISLGNLKGRMGDAAGAEQAFTEALQLALNVLTAARDRAQGAHPEFFFEQGRAMQIYADSALNLASVWGGEPESRAAHALAGESLRLRPLSSSARIQVGVAMATYGAATLGTRNSSLAPKLFLDSTRQFDELAQWDPDNRRLQRENAALHLLIAEGTATCAETAACKATLGRGALEDAEIATLHSIGQFRQLAGLDTENRSLKQDVAWGLQVQSEVLRALGRPDKALRLLDEAVTIRRESVVDMQDVQQRLTIPSLFLEKGQLLESSKPLEALAALDASLAEIDRLPENLSSVMVSRFNTVDAKINLLKKLGRAGEAGRLAEQNERLRDRMGEPWDKKKKLAQKAHDEGVQLAIEAAKLAGTAALTAFQAALEKYQAAIAEYPFDDTYWMSQRNAYQWIANIGGQLDTAVTAATDASPDSVKSGAAGTAHADDREAALRGALTAAWMARVLGDSATSWKDLYEARRGLAIFLRDRGRTGEVLPLVAQGVLDAEEYARQQPGSTDALFLLADANAGLGLLRLDAKNDGWEEALRKGLAYGDRLAGMEPRKAEHRQWVGGFRRDLGDGLREAHREDAAAEEYKLAVQDCREALRLAARGPAAERDNIAKDSQACLDDLAALGYK